MKLIEEEEITVRKEDREDWGGFFWGASGGMEGSGGRKRIERETRDSTRIWYRASTQG